MQRAEGYEQKVGEALIRNSGGLVQTENPGWQACGRLYRAALRCSDKPLALCRIRFSSPSLMTYSFPAYVSGIAFAIAALAALVGLILLTCRKPLAAALSLFGVAVLAGGIIGPMLALDRVVLDDHKLEQTTGFWFAPTVKGFQLDEVASLTITVVRGRKDLDYEVWTAQMKNGGSKQVDPGDLWEMNGADIIERLRKRGIEVRRL